VEVRKDNVVSNRRRYSRSDCGDLASWNRRVSRHGEVLTLAALQVAVVNEKIAPLTQEWGWWRQRYFRFGLRFWLWFLTLIQGLCLTAARLFSRELNMKKMILVGIAILAVSTSAALAKKHAMKPKASAAATSTSSAGPFMGLGQVSAADHAMYMKNKHDSGMK
jgi:fucose 4-O-acetylase-like acetyltransferase